MKILLQFVLASLLTVSTQVCKADDVLTSEQDRLQGTWRTVGAVDSGTPEYKDRFETLKLKIKGEHYVYDFGDHSFSATFTLDPNKSPKQMDVTFWEGPLAGKVMQAIYNLDGDELKICTAQYKRPTDFTSTLESQNVLFTFQRDLPSKDVSGAEILGYGLYKSLPIEMAPFSSTVGTPVQIETTQLIKQTDQIPAVLNTHFGIQFVIHGTPKGKLVDLRQVILFPPTPDAKTGKITTRDEVLVKIGLEDNKDVGAYLTLDSPSDLVPGLWTFQIFDHDRKLLEKIFTVVKP